MQPIFLGLILACLIEYFKIVLQADMFCEEFEFGWLMRLQRHVMVKYKLSLIDETRGVEYGVCE